ncbi:hypothetical protein BGW36DRAFT_38886 [Talaromyces proteolyticus]|uniref:Chromo domain-containing protein n=1 Tax=Talaromyces proteolyticus TaxID=1131652 RepID=A0AAD4KHE4_9EURO|nr:uncharacterized protein BGW36DRAFT_38886 [Talaromyces proteolyticus]KAH8691845.1 hypothetical protein BGW36DRAFT_38886 [Talaromyces proteolyticus]
MVPKKLAGKRSAGQSLPSLQPADWKTASSSRSNNPGPIRVGRGYAEYEIEKLIDRIVLNEDTFYRVRWRGYSHEYDWWYHINDLDNAKDLVDEYERNLKERMT